MIVINIITVNGSNIPHYKYKLIGKIKNIYIITMRKYYFNINSNNEKNNCIIKVHN